MTKRVFETMYQKYFSSIYCYLVSLCQDQDLAEELTSETFFKAIKALDRFDERCSLNSWLCQIAKYSYFDYLRKKKRLVELDSLVELEDTHMNLENQMVDFITSEEIRKKLDELKEPYRRVFQLRIIDEFSFKQIGAMYGKTENWACVTYHRARKLLKERMEE